MKLDTSSYYPPSPLGDEDPEEKNPAPSVETPVAAPAPDAVAAPSAAAAKRADGDPEYETAPFGGEPETPGDDLSTFATRLSNILSWVLVPLLMPVYGVILAFSLSLLSFTGLGTRVVFTLIVACFNLVIPAVIVLLLKKFGIVHDVGLNGRKERLIPYLICILCLGGTAIFMACKGAPMWLVMFFAGGAVAGLVEVVVNFWWKISVHAAGIAGIVALLLRIMLDGYPTPAVVTWIMVTVGLAGLLGAARIWLGRHTVAQVFAGYLVGFLSVFLMTMIK